MATDVNATLAARGNRYGDFKTHAEITQGLKDVFHGYPNWKVLTPSQKEALEMIAHKIGRIMNGDPNYADSWHDIAGYASLVDQELATTLPAYTAAPEAPPVARPFVQPPTQASPSTAFSPALVPSSPGAEQPAPRPATPPSSPPPPPPGGPVR